MTARSGVAVAIVLTLICAWLLAYRQLRSGPTQIYQIAGGYRGWVIFTWGNASCRPHGSWSSAETFEVAPSGRGCTSDPADSDWHATVYEYTWPSGAARQLPQTVSGGGGLIWAESFHPKQANRTFACEVFFVGTEKELQGSWATEPQPGVNTAC